jgi:putative spermidine/putrescine transport system substrate-binding protein
MKGRKLVVASFGGSYQEALRAAWYKPFADEFGVDIIEDGPPTNAKIVSMVESGNVTWDVCQTGGNRVGSAGAGGYLEPIDYSTVDASTIVDGFHTEWGTGVATIATVVAYRTDVIEGDGPQSVIDLWDTKRFPGMRGLSDLPSDCLPMAVLAAGVPKNEIYPLTEEKLSMAFAKLKELNGSVIWWTGGAQSTQLLANKEVTLLQTWNGRLAPLAESGVPLKIVWDGALMLCDMWVVPKGAPNKDLAMLFIAWSSIAENNARLSEYIPYGPVNRDAFNLVKEDRKALMPSTYSDQMIKADYAWWGANYEAMMKRWQEWRLG